MAEHLEKTKTGELLDTPVAPKIRSDDPATHHEGKKNVFIIGYDDFHRELLREMQYYTDLTFHTLLEMEELRGADDLPVEQMIDKADERLHSFHGSIDGIVTFIDFPALEIASILSQKYGTPGPSLESILKCSHKYWSRLLQQEVAPQTVPQFACFNPYRDDALQQIPFDYPFWIKPVNSYRSHLGFRIRNEKDFQEALPIIREELPRLANPLAKIMDRAELPIQVDEEDIFSCLAEQIISGKQCTLEGYAIDGNVHVYGVVDSIREANQSSFSRYQYPSSIPQHIQHRMIDVSKRVIKNIGLQNSAFNIEFFYNQQQDNCWLLEVNPRISQSHCELFKKVDGMSNHRVVLDVMMGRDPDMPERQGDYHMAAKFFLRSFSAAIITHAPDREQIKEIEQQVPGTTIQVLVEPGTHLADLADQDSYSYELAWIWAGGNSQAELMNKYNRVEELLHIEMERTEPDSEHETTTVRT